VDPEDWQGSDSIQKDKQKQLEDNVDKST